MIYREYKYFVLSDLYRYSGDIAIKTFLKDLFRGESFAFLFWMRTCKYLRLNKILYLTLYPLAHFMLVRYTYRLGISIPFMTEIGAGFYITHHGDIVISPFCKIGRNCNISQGVTLGQANRGKNKGFPIIGDNVYLGPGAKIVGAVRIGNNVAVGANSVVTKDAPDNAVIVGVPGKIISYKGSEGYVNKTDYERIIRRRKNKL